MIRLYARTVLLFLVLSLGSSLRAQIFESGGINYSIVQVYNILPEEEPEYVDVAYVYKGDYSGHVEIPAEVFHGGKVYPVVGIYGEAFSNCSNLTSISIPNSVTTIGTEAFFRCTSLKSIVLPNSVTEINVGAFKYCWSLETVVLPEGLKEVTNLVFLGCSSLASINIPASVKEIDDFAFWRCTGLKSISLPDGLEDIGQGTFQECSSLTSITLPASIQGISIHAFYQSGLKTINVKSSTPVKMLEGYDYFDENIHATATLHVPHGAKSAYRSAAVWKNFANITEGFSATSINEKELDEEAVSVKAYYDANGRRINTLQRGMNIVVYDNGHVSKKWVD